MAYSGTSSLPHNKTTVLYAYTPYDYGPLNIIGVGHIQNFVGGSYYVTTPKEKVTLYRVYGGNAGQYGQYWTTQPPTGNESYRWDAAALPQWNTMDQTSTLVVPEGVYLYEGRVTHQAHYLGGGWQVFIPWEIVNLLAEIQPHRMIENGFNPSIINRIIEQINSTQKRTMEQYSKTMNELLQGQALNHGSELGSIPPNIRNFIQSQGGHSNSSQGIQTGRYVVHRDSIPVRGGGRRNITVSVRIEFDHSETRKYQSGQTIVTETTHYYNRITEIN
ncbi:uncharacterized protein LOC128559927 [Mercenaria mercenaria]|uniref:uncharacterized protein LOC128559927 n=1 Tax=Mercenaria mercenaria TaxID=6596 RepID=UPI00234E8E11|nr:uncharacterized protein LOC128559927 [Mercenaria mercenaria]